MQMVRRPDAMSDIVALMSDVLVKADWELSPAKNGGATALCFADDKNRLDCQTQDDRAAGI